MKLNLSHNWIAKILSLLLAIAIWFLIKNHLDTSETHLSGAADPFANAPRATPVKEGSSPPPKNSKQR